MKVQIYVRNLKARHRTLASLLASMFDNKRESHTLEKRKRVFKINIREKNEKCNLVF
jgi:hypothetical protein